MKALSATGAMALAGCIGVGENPDSGSADTTETTTNSKSMAQDLKMWSAANAETFTLAQEQYSQDTNATVTINNMASGDLMNKLKSSLISGTGSPDVAMVQTRFVPGVMQTDSLEDLAPRIGSDDLRDKFISGVWESVSDGDSIYAMPWDIGPTAVYYRRDVFEQAGISVDDIETWDDFISEGDKLDEETSLISLAPNEYANTWRFLFRQLGGEPFTEDGAVNIHSEKAVRAAKLMKDMKEAGVANTSSGWTQNWFSNFKSGSTASVAMGAWFSGTLKSELSDTSGQWGMFKLPAFEKGGNRASKNGGSSLVIPKQLNNAETNRAWDFTKFATANPEIMAKTYGEYGNFPAFKQVYDNEAFKREDEFFGGQRVGSLLTEVARDIPSYRFTPDTTTVSDAVTRYVRKMMNDDLSPRDAMKQAAEQVSRKTDRELA